jgi:hypothetical protein
MEFCGLSGQVGSPFRVGSILMIGAVTTILSSTKRAFLYSSYTFYLAFFRTVCIPIQRQDQLIAVHDIDLAFLGGAGPTTPANLTSYDLDLSFQLN